MSNQTGKETQKRYKIQIPSFEHRQRRPQPSESGSSLTFEKLNLSETKKTSSFRDRGLRDSHIDKNKQNDEKE